MGRPDLKQELVSHWQKDFNSIPDDMREDEETKAELHLRLDVRTVHNIIQCKYSSTDHADPLKTMKILNIRSCSDLCTGAA